MMSLRNSLGLTARTLAPCLGLLAACAQQPAPAPTPIPASHQLQGTWKDGDVSVTIEGNSLYFHEPGRQYDTTLTLIPDTDPAELRTTILDTPRTTDGAGEVVFAIYKFEEETLHLAAINKVEGEAPSFDDVSNYYLLERAPASE